MNIVTTIPQTIRSARKFRLVYVTYDAVDSFRPVCNLIEGGGGGAGTVSGKNDIIRPLLSMRFFVVVVLKKKKLTSINHRLNTIDKLSNFIGFP